MAQGIDANLGFMQVAEVSRLRRGMLKVILSELSSRSDWSTLVLLHRNIQFAADHRTIN